LTTQRNKVHHVTTIERVAQNLGADVDLIHDLVLGLEREDGLIWVYGLAEHGILAFTDEGIEEVRRLLDEYRPDAASQS
jgi:hypothetical protein